MDGNEWADMNRPKLMAYINFLNIGILCYVFTQFAFTKICKSTDFKLKVFYYLMTNLCKLEVINFGYNIFV